MEFVSKEELEQQIEEEKKLAARSLGFLKKLYPVVKDAGYDFKFVDNDEFRNLMAETACSDVELLKKECVASKILFDGYSDNDIIEAIKNLIKQNVTFVHPRNSIAHYAKLVKMELELRRSSIKWVLDNEFTNLRVTKYHINIMKFAPNTTMLMILLAFNKMEREGLIK